jgi:hypothetical protein
MCYSVYIIFFLVIFPTSHFFLHLFVFFYFKNVKYDKIICFYIIFLSDYFTIIRVYNIYF